LSFSLKKTTYIDGLWQSANYFSDIESILREDLRIKEPSGVKNLEALAWIKLNRAVAIHVRWFGPALSGENVPCGYYHAARHNTHRPRPLPVQHGHAGLRRR